MIYDNRKINHTLLNAIINNRNAEIESLLSNTDANPDAVLDIPAGCDPVMKHIITAALFMNNGSTICVILKHSKHVIDFSQNLPKNTTHSAMNLLHFACLYGTNAITEIFEYIQDKTPHISIAKILNEKLTLESPCGLLRKENIGSVLLKTFSHNLVQGNFLVLSDSLEVEEKIGVFISKWMRSGPKSPIDKDSYFKEPIELVWHGPQRTLKTLIENGLNIDVTDSQGNTIINICEALYKKSKNAALWDEHLKKNMRIEKISISSLSQIDSEGDANFCAIIKNKYGLYPTEFKFTVQYDALIKYLKEVRAKKSEVAIQSLPMMTFQHQIAKTESRVQALESKVSAINQQRLLDIRNLLSSKGEVNLLECFNVIQARINNHFDARKVQTTNLFKSNTKDQKINIARNAIVVFELVGANVPFIFTSVIAGIAKAGLDFAEKTKLQADNNSFFDATLGLDTESISIDIAMLLTSEIAKLYGNGNNRKLAEQLSALIISQIDRLSSFDPTLKPILVGFLCKCAVEKLHPELEMGYSSNGSTSSGSSGHSVNFVPALTNGNSSPSKAKRRNRGMCVIC